jgi:hypothetical protein
MISIDPNSIRCDSDAEGAALGLLGLMTGLSEEYWCAGWMSGLEHSLWGVESGTRFGMGTITDRQAELLRLLSDECDGWWYWHDADPVELSGPKFIRRAEWEAKCKMRAK